MTCADDIISHHLYEPREGVERLENYRPGGYHPIRIGDRFQDRYQTLHKLGHGSYSTKWLARDEVSKEYVAVKVCTADSKPRDFNILSELSGRLHASDKSPGETMVPVIMEIFTIHGPNGEHECYVTAPARASLAGVKDGSWVRLFKLDTARVLAAQLVIAVEYIHARGYVHGDLHLGNVLLKCHQNSISSPRKVI
ncbi:hypothetical protein MferCBS31731_004146 [Microsporum ferrugineum]